MQNRSTTLGIRVPASTSNLGPGFDLLGLALSLYLEVRAEPLRDANAHRVTRLGSLFDELGDSERDLTVQAFERVASNHGLEQHYHFVQSSEIPTGRGLGSSGAAIVAGLLLARAACRGDVSTQELISIGIEIEGHPDNVVASLLGGLTFCQLTGPRKEPLWMQPQLHPTIAFSVVWPSTPLATEASRAVLPAQVPFAHAVENPGRLALLLEGLRSGNSELLHAGELDHLHVPHRLPLIQGSEATLKAAHEQGAWLATISGSGSSLIALGPKERIQQINKAMQQSFSRFHEDVQARVLEPVLGTPSVTSRARP